MAVVPLTWCYLALHIFVIVHVESVYAYHHTTILVLEKNVPDDFITLLPTRTAIYNACIALHS